MDGSAEMPLIGFQPAGSEIAQRIGEFHGHLMWIGGGLAGLVFLLLLFVCWRFCESRHPVPWQVSRAPLLEFALTVVPVLVLTSILVPSLKLIAAQSEAPDSDLSVKVGAHQWFWRYEYPDNGGIAFNSTMLPPNSLAPGQRRLLEVDNRLVLPVGKAVRLYVTSSDVIHSFFVPALGIQIYAIPGRLNETWVRIDEPGIYYGQCNQICGLDHAFMPIAVEAVSETEFEDWVVRAAAANGGGG